MLKHQFQGDVFEEQVFRRTQDGGQAFLFFFGHGRQPFPGEQSTLCALDGDHHQIGHPERSGPLPDLLS
jgi:hypothetical protein